MNICRTSTSTLSAVSLRGGGQPADAMLPDLGFHSLIQGALTASQKPVLVTGHSPPEMVRRAESDPPEPRDGSGGIGEMAAQSKEIATGAVPQAGEGIGPPDTPLARGTMAAQGRLLPHLWWPSQAQDLAAAGSAAGGQDASLSVALPIEASAGGDVTELSEGSVLSLQAADHGAVAPAMGVVPPQHGIGAPDALRDRLRVAPRRIMTDLPPPDEISAGVTAKAQGPGSGLRMERQAALAHPGMPRPGEAPDRPVADLAAPGDLPIRAGPAMTAAMVPLTELPLGLKTPPGAPGGAESPPADTMPPGEDRQIIAVGRDETSRPLWVELPGRVQIGRLGGELRALVIEHMRPAGQSLFQIRMDPVELGQLRITLQMTEAGLHIQIMAERPETLDLMRRFSADLMQDLRQMGFSDLMMSFSDQQHRALQPAPERRAFPVEPESPGPVQILGVALEPSRVGSGGMDLRL